MTENKPTREDALSELRTNATSFDSKMTHAGFSQAIGLIEETAARPWLDLVTELNAGEASDGHHTHNELYDFRMVYNALLFNAWHRDGYAQVVKSRYHHDGARVFGGGWFIVQAILPTGTQVSNHYREAHWDKFAIPAVDRPEEWDGHSPEDVLYRLTTLAMLENAAESHAAGAAEQIRHPGGKDGWWLAECIHPGCDYQTVQQRPEDAEARVNQHATAKNRATS